MNKLTQSMECPQEVIGTKLVKKYLLV